MENVESLGDLPLTDKIQSASIFELLHLPLTSDLTIVRKSYYKKMDKLEIDQRKTSTQEEKDEINKSIRTLERAFLDFSQNIQKNTQDLFQVNEAMKNLGLNQDADWNAIEEKYQKAHADLGTSDKNSWGKSYEVLRQKQEWFKQGPGNSKRTVYAIAGVLATVGISIAAMSQFSDLNFAETLANLKDALTPGSNENKGIGDSQNTGEEMASSINSEFSGLNEYIEQNSTLEDEIMSNMGLIPDINQTLSVEYKLQMFQALVNKI